MRLGDYINIKTGKLDANEACVNGKYPFFTCSVVPLKIDSFSFDCECVLVAGNGDLNVKYYNGKFDAYQRTYIIETKTDNLNARYLFYFLKKHVEVLRKESTGGVIKFIKKGNITEANIPLPATLQQESIVRHLDTIHANLECKKQQMDKLDALIKSRFMEMFGDPISNSKQWPTEPLSGCCQMNGIKKYPRQDKYWILNLDKIESGTGAVLAKDYVSIDMVGNSTFFFDESYVLYSKLRPYLNKVALPDEPGFATTELVPLKPASYINRTFLAALLRTESFVAWIDSTSSGAKMPRASMDSLRGFKVIAPPITLQNDFASFVNLIDKSRFVCHSRNFL